MDKISVITPAFNRKEFIKECIESVNCSQKISGLEIEHIVVDDGSTDGTVELVQDISNNYPNLKLIKLEKNQGPAAARNEGIKQAMGNFIFCLDSDDLIFQNSLLILYREMKNTNLGWVYGDFVRGDEKGAYLIGQDYWGYQFKSTTDALIAMYTGKHFFQHSFMMTKELFEKVGGYDTDIKMAEDFDLCTRFLLAGENPKYVTGALFMHRFHKSNISAQITADPTKHLNDVMMLKEKYKDMFPAEVLSKIL